MPQVTIKYEKAYDAVEWAKENCTSFVTCKPNSIQLRDSDGNFGYPIEVDFVFWNKTDAVLFSLRWS